ncbi:DNA alkylation repair protein [Candidatus Woesearchaeota archaeon]|nr:DNA alkylation repair protein [Candidatus Woesearchaeota archaeon]
MLNQLAKEIKEHSHPDKAKIYARFFKTGKGQYGEGDVFLGLTVPEQRELAKKYVNLGLSDLKKLIYNKYHEHRLTGFFILVYKYQKANEREKQKIVDFYIKHKNRSNNWDLIDCVADKLLGKHLINKDKSLLYELAKSQSLWDRRIAIITTFEFLKNHKFDDTIKISEILLNDSHDLIHKAVGWMLREMGKRDEKELMKFLDKHHKNMPRTMLRYAIERLDNNKKEFYLKK